MPRRNGGTSFQERTRKRRKRVGQRIQSAKDLGLKGKKVPAGPKVQGRRAKLDAIRREIEKGKKDGGDGSSK